MNNEVEAHIAKENYSDRGIKISTTPLLNRCRNSRFNIRASATSVTYSLYSNSTLFTCCKKDNKYQINDDFILFQLP